MIIQVTTSLLPHQKAAADKVSPVRVGALLMDMGTGKSLTAIDIAARRQKRISRVVWFCPVSLRDTGTIALEIQKHVASPAIYTFNDRTRQGSIPAAGWYIIGTESLSQSRRVLLAAHSLIDGETMVVLDESLDIKNPFALRTRRVTQICERARYRLLLTGTPVSKSIADLYAQFKFLSPDILGYTSFYSFAANHLEYSEKYPGKVVRAHNTALIAAKIAPYTFQVSKEECLDLPPKAYSQHGFLMTPAQRDLYTKAMDTILSDDYGTDTQNNDVLIYRLFGALQQVTCGFWKQYPSVSDRRNWIYRTEKTEPFPEPILHEVPHYRLNLLQHLIAEIPEGEKVIIWTKYHRCIEEIAALAQEQFESGVSRFYGKVPSRQRETELSGFRGENRFFVATPSTGGLGLTLNEASYVIFYTDDFNFATRMQAEDRCHRIGQEKRVTYASVVCADSIDQRIQDNLATKGQTLQDFRQKVHHVRDKRTLKQAFKEFLSA